MRRRYQFRLRTLFWLTAAVAGVLAAGPGLMRPAGSTCLRGELGDELLMVGGVKSVL